MKSTLKSALAVALLSCSMAALAASTTMHVELIGPGGHSNGSYGNVNAVHACARVVEGIARQVPDALVANLNGGNSVNSIAGDCSFTVTVQGNAQALRSKTAKVRKAVEAGCNAENAFRQVKAGDLVKGAPAQIRYTVR